MGDYCVGPCGQLLDVEKAVYPGPGGLRCSTCQILAETHAELLRIEAIVRALVDAEATEPWVRSKNVGRA